MFIYTNKWLFVCLSEAPLRHFTLSLHWHIPYQNQDNPRIENLSFSLGSTTQSSQPSTGWPLSRNLFVCNEGSQWKRLSTWIKRSSYMLHCWTDIGDTHHIGLMHIYSTSVLCSFVSMELSGVHLKMIERKKRCLNVYASDIHLLADNTQNVLRWENILTH